MLGCSQSISTPVPSVLHSPPCTAIFPSFHFKGCFSPSVTTAPLPNLTDSGSSSCLHPFPAHSQNTPLPPHPLSSTGPSTDTAWAVWPRGRRLHRAMCRIPGHSLAARAVPAPASCSPSLGTNTNCHRIRHSLGALPEGDLAGLSEFCSCFFFTPLK